MVLALGTGVAAAAKFLESWGGEPVLCGAHKPSSWGARLSLLVGAEAIDMSQFIFNTQVILVVLNQSEYV